MVNHGKPNAMFTIPKSSPELCYVYNPQSWLGIYPHFRWWIPHYARTIKSHYISMISPWELYIYYMCIMSPFQVIKIPMMFHQSDYWNLAIRGDNCSTASWSPCGASTGNPWSLLVVRALGRFLSHQWCTSTGKSEAWWFRVIFLNWNWPPKHAICWVWV